MNTNIGLDTETTNANPEQSGCWMIQLGIALPNNGPTFVSDVGIDLVQVGGFVTFSEEAMKINGFTRERIQLGPDIERVEEDAIAFLLKNHVYDFTPVGWNVGEFDMTLIKRVMPKLAAMRTSHHAIDLNSVVYTLAQIANTPSDSVKRSAKEYATERMQHDNEHDAGYDAVHALHCWDYLTKPHFRNRRVI